MVINYIEAYNEMIELLEKSENAKSQLFNFYNIPEANDTISEIIEKNSDFNESVNEVIDFVEKFNKLGVILEKDFKEFQDLVNKKEDIKRIIFAAKEKLYMSNNTIYDDTNLSNDLNKYLLYNSESSETITWNNLIRYFNGDNLYKIILRNSTEQEKRFYNAYIDYIRKLYNYNENKIMHGYYPNLLPQYVLNNRTTLIKENNVVLHLIHRVDFALILNGVEILIDINEPQYNPNVYEDYYNAYFDRISNERRIDRELTLEGYEVYRFLVDDIAKRNDYDLIQYVSNFFEKLFKKHNIKI